MLYQDRVAFELIRAEDKLWQINGIRSIESLERLKAVGVQTEVGTNWQTCSVAEPYSWRMKIKVMKTHPTGSNTINKKM